MKSTPKLVILFDGSCNFCTACISFFQALDWRHRLCCLPFQAPDAPQTYGLTVAQCEQSAWAITPDGHIYQGAQAVSAVLDAIIAIPLFVPLYRVPGIRQLEDRVYAWVAAHRRFFPGVRPYCDRPGLPCGTRKTC